MPQRELLAAVVVTLLVAAVVPAGAAASHGGESNCGFPYTATDATGTEVTLTEEPQRVVVLGPSGAQTAWEVGASEKVVGIDAFSTYLEGANDTTVVSQGQGSVDYEAALGLDPDLIVVAGNSYTDEVAAEFRRSNVSVFKMPGAGNFSAIAQKTHTYGHLLGACEGASEAAAELNASVDRVREAVAGEQHPSLFYSLGANQAGDAYFSAGPNTFVGAVVSTAGADNVVSAGNFSSPYPQVSNEFILEQDPEWLLVTYTPGSSFGPATAEAARAAVNDSDVLSQTTAAQQGQIIAVNANNLNQPAPRVARALSAIAAELHPEAYAAANATATATETDGSSADGVPGFGAGAALVALTGLALVARRYQ